MYNFDMNNFGNRLKELRNEKGITQRAMAEELNISISTLSHWECDYQEPAFKDLILLCTFFDVTADEILGISESGSAPVIAPIGDKYTASERELIAKYRKLSPDLKEMLNGIIGTWTGENPTSVGAKKITKT